MYEIEDGRADWVYFGCGRVASRSCRRHCPHCVDHCPHCVDHVMLKDTHPLPFDVSQVKRNLRSSTGKASEGVLEIVKLFSCDNSRVAVKQAEVYCLTAPRLLLKSGACSRVSLCCTLVVPEGENKGNQHGIKHFGVALWYFRCLYRSDCDCPIVRWPHVRQSRRKLGRGRCFFRRWF